MTKRKWNPGRAREVDPQESPKGLPAEAPPIVAPPIAETAVAPASPAAPPPPAEKPAEASAHEMNPPVVDVGPASACPQCGSTKRSDYYLRQEQAHSGLTLDGRSYTLIIRRRCRCLDCGQVRIDREYV